MPTDAPVKDDDDAQYYDDYEVDDFEISKTVKYDGHHIHCMKECEGYNNNFDEELTSAVPPLCDFLNEVYYLCDTYATAFALCVTPKCVEACTNEDYCYFGAAKAVGCQIDGKTPPWLGNSLEATELYRQCNRSLYAAEAEAGVAASSEEAEKPYYPLIGECFTVPLPLPTPLPVLIITILLPPTSYLLHPPSSLLSPPGLWLAMTVSVILFCSWLATRRKGPSGGGDLDDRSDHTTSELMETVEVDFQSPLSAPAQNPLHGGEGGDRGGGGGGGRGGGGAGGGGGGDIAVAMEAGKGRRVQNTAMGFVKSAKGALGSEGLLSKGMRSIFSSSSSSRQRQRAVEMSTKGMCKLFIFTIYFY